jgi:3-oxoadipate enol-lactonase
VKVAANGVGLRYALEGPAGAPLVTLAHPLAAALELWEPQVAARLGAGYRVLRYDARGHGGSEAPPGPSTTPQMAEDLRGLWDALGVARSHVVGLSMGGIVGMETALRWPERVGGLVLADTTSRYAPARRPRCGRSGSAARRPRAARCSGR